MQDPAFRFRRWASVAAAAAALLLGGGTASAAIDKDATYQEMLGLAQQMKTLKPQLRTNAQAAADYATAEARYRTLSASMGGDDPGHLGIRGGGGATAVHRHRVTTKGASPVAGCGASTATFSNTTPVTIPTGPGVVTSTIDVSGAGPYLFDVNVLTHIQHTFSADLDITITSPSGTVVTLTTDNGGSNDDVFNGTLWDDSANPGGQVPYTTNDGLVTDQAYVNLTLASPLVPEEALGAFIGEDPNGTWTLTISDDLAGDGGSLNDWSLDLTTFPNAPVVATLPTVTNSTPVTIPTGPGVVTSTIDVSGATSPIFDVNLTTFIQHTFSADLDITITSPSGTVVTLTTDNGGSNDDVFNGTVWDDSANPGGQVPYTTNDGLVTDQAYANLTLASPLVPEEALAAFIGEDPNGTWTLTVSDDLAGDGGSLNSWSIDIQTFTCSMPDLSLTKVVQGSGSVQIGDNVTYTLTATNNGTGDATGVTVTDTLPTGLSYVSNDCGASFADPTLTWAIGTLADGASAACNLTATVTQEGAIVNAATISGNETDPQQGNNTGSATLAGVIEVPTLDNVGLAILMAVLAASAMLLLRRRRRA